MSQPQHVTDATFATEVLENDLPALVDFWAPWCGPCRLVGPIVDEIAAEYDGRLAVFKLNTDENPETARRFHIQSIPALILFRDGRPVKEIVGYRPKQFVVQNLEAVLGAGSAAPA